MSEKPTIIVDFRERASKVPELIVKKGASVRFNQLVLGDYIISKRIAVERKTSSDFIKSIYDGRLFDQIKRLSESYELPVLIVEGNLEEQLIEMQNPNVFRGALVSLAIYYNAKIFYSENESETADYLVILARQENKKKEILTEPIIKGKPKIFDNEKWVYFVVQSLPYVGPKNAKLLLERFHSIRNLANSSMIELSSVLGIAKAKKVYEILNYEIK